MADRAAASIVTIVPLPTAWRGRCSPGGATIVRQLPLARRLVGADQGEREVLEGAQRDAVARRETAVLAIAAIVDRVGRSRESIAVERAVDHGRDPPAGDRVLAELEETGGHLSRPRS